MNSNSSDPASRRNSRDPASRRNGRDPASGRNGRDLASGRNGRDWVYGGNGRDPTSRSRMMLLPHFLIVLTFATSSCQVEDNQITHPCCGTPGIPGVPGTHGNVGTPGRDGRDGREGAPGMSGAKGDPGEPGLSGARGQPGSDGPPGKQGERGDQGECAVSPRSAFSAKLSESRSPPMAGQPVPFGKVLANEQGHYNPETGRFRCAVPGLYYFSLHGTVYRGNLHLQLMKNGHSQASFFQPGDAAKPGGLCGGAAFHLEPGDEVWVQLGDYPGLYASSGTDSVFTGFLIYSDWEPHPVFKPLTSNEKSV